MGRHLPAVTLIEEHCAQNAVAGITFNQIPGWYRDLRLVIRGRGDKAATNIICGLRFNADAGNNYDQTFTQNSGATVTGNETRADTNISVGVLPAANATASVAGYVDYSIFDYAGAVFNKTMHILCGLKIGTAAGNIFVRNGTGMWRSSVPIYQIFLFPDANSFVAGTTASLYGIM
jgi:hypothetical protein